MNVSSFFQGAALKFRLDGEGVTLDPETGELGVTAEALSAGLTVLVTARAADGATEQSFRLKLAAEPSESAPVLLSAPELDGAGFVGAELEVVPGIWGGQPAPAIALQWQRGGVEIQDATGASYVPQAQDDGQEITCRVTATNDSGTLSAEPEAILVTRVAPAVVDLIADIAVEQDADPVVVDAAAAFSGEGLGFAVAGGGAAIDPETGRLTLPTDVLRDGETVTVTASNTGGSADASFLLTVTEPVVVEVPVVPAALTAPSLTGTATIGREVVVETGLWSGLPVPVLALQWLRDGTEIEGATAAAYVPVNTDDRCALSCRVTATNKAGTLAVETAALSVTHVAPTLAGELVEEVFDQGAGVQTIETAAVFAGENLGFAASGAGVEIDAATGVLSISTDTALSETVTVTAGNSGGSVSASFLLTIEATSTELGYVHPDLVKFGGVPAAEGGVIFSDSLKAYVQRARLVLKAGIVIPKTHELLLVRSLTATPDKTWLTKVQALPGLESYDGSADATWDSGGGGADGVIQYLFLYWRDLESGTVTEALEIPAKFNSVAPAPNTGNNNSGSFRAADQTLSAANQTSLKAALDARISSGSSAEWIIDLPNGNYGPLLLADKILPGKTIIRSQNQALGAKFATIELARCKNIYFQLVDTDYTARGSYADHNVAFLSSSYCGIEYSRIYAGPIIVASGAPNGLGWVYNTRWNVRVDNTYTTPSDHIRIHMNLITGVCEKAIYFNGSFDGEISDNVFENCGGDQMYASWGGRNQILRNWGARATYPKYSGGGDPYDHSDFWQSYSASVPMFENKLIGNVFMVANNGFAVLPRQGIFGSKTLARDWLYRDNIICNNSYHGITITGTGGATDISNMTALNNTVLRCIDMPQPDQHTVQISLQGGSGLQFNVQCGYAGNTSMGSNGLNIPMTNTDHTASLAYYTAPYMASSFYDLRPVTGKVTHWAYSAGTPVGAHQRFYDVIVGGAYPKIGPAATAWKTWYDPKKQITS